MGTRVFFSDWTQKRVVTLLSVVGFWLFLRIVFTLFLRVSKSSDAATHVIAAAHGRLDHTVSIRAFGHTHLGSVILGNVLVYQFLAALGALHPGNTHPARVTNVICHQFSPFERGYSPEL
jgi:hypothetical protein